MNLLNKVKTLKTKSLYRSLTNADLSATNIIKRDGKKLINFASNDYFGLANHKKIKKSAIKASKKFGLGVKSSRFLSGNSSLYQKLEQKLAAHNNQDDALIFPSGYQAAIGAIPALATAKDLIIADKLIHASLIDAATLSKAKFLRFDHNDTEKARNLLEIHRKNHQNALIISESVFSMDGDLGKIDELQQLATEFDCRLVIDNAHNIYPCDSAPNVINLGTLSKKFATFGGFVTSDAATIDYLRNFAKSAIYTTALPPSILAASISSVDIIAKEKPQQKTMQNAQYFANLMNLKPPKSPIIIIELENVEKTLEIVQKIAEEGLLISAIRPPTAKTPRLRITFNAKHRKKHIEKLANALKKHL